MRTNRISLKAGPQRRKAEMYAIIDRWKNSNESQKDICKAARASYHVFKYWQKKQNIENDRLEDAKKNNLPAKSVGTFIPVAVESTTGFIELQIEYPNGVRISCPESITSSQLKELIKLF